MICIILPIQKSIYLHSLYIVLYLYITENTKLIIKTPKQFYAFINIWLASVKIFIFCSSISKFYKKFHMNLLRHEDFQHFSDEVQMHGTLRTKARSNSPTCSIEFRAVGPGDFMWNFHAPLGIDSENILK